MKYYSFLFRKERGDWQVIKSGLTEKEVREELREGRWFHDEFAEHGSVSVQAPANSDIEGQYVRIFRKNQEDRHGSLEWLRVVTDGNEEDQEGNGIDARG